MATAVVGYDITRRAMTRAMRTLSTGRSAAADRRRFLTPWLAGLVAMVLAASLYPVARLTSVIWAFQALGAAPLGLVLAVIIASRLGATGPDTPKPIRRRWWWIVAAGLAYALYCTTMGLGMGMGMGMGMGQQADAYSGMSAKLEP